MPPQYATGTVGRSKEFGKAAVNFVSAFILSFAFMYMILAAQFESFLDPVTILLSLPLSVPFALLSLKIANENYNIIYTSVGILVLFGIVKKNSILQIDHIKRLRGEGLERSQAILKGCEDRLRPILMTTAALVAGMIPLAFGGGAGSGSRRTVAIVVIGGQTMCLLLSLLVTPVVYSLFDDMSNWHVFTRMGGFFRRRSLKQAFAGLLGMLLFAVPGFSAEIPARVGVGKTQKRMMLKDAVELALQNNLDIQIEKTNTVLSQSQYRQTFGVWDPVLGYRPNLSFNVTPTSSPLQAADGRLVDRNFSNNFSYSQKSPWQGTRLDAAFSNGRLSTSNPFSGLNPYTLSTLVLNLTQPLLRGRKIDNDRNQIRLRRKQIDISEADYELRVIQVVTLVTQGYWNLVAARQDIDVKRQSVDLAKGQYERSKRQIDAGTLAPVELSGALAELERRQDSYYSSIGLVTEVENNLKSLLAGGRDQTIWDDEVIPVETQNAAPPALDDLKGIVKGAVDRRPELRNLRLRLEANEFQKDFAKNQLLPGANLTAGYTMAGLAGDRNTAINPFFGGSAGALVPPSFIGGYGTTLSSLFGQNYSSWQAGLQFDWTVRNRTARESLAQVNLSERALGLQRARAEQAVEAEVRNSLQALRTAEQRIVAAEASVKAAKEKLDSEQRLFETGESTNFLVLTRQNEYADSQRRSLVARLDFNKAIAQLQQALGVTLETNNISLK